MKKQLLALVLLNGAAGMAYGGQVGASRVITFSMDRSGPATTRYEIQLDASTGKGQYHQDAAVGSAGGAAMEGAQPATLAFEAPVAVDPPTLKKLLATTSAITRHHCESHNTGIAQTGKKTLRLSEGALSTECTYNYSDDDRVNTATNLFEAIGETLQFGQRLVAKLRFDRLGLDAEMDNLQSAVHEGRAIELNNIAAILQNIQNDDRVMDRVRRKAAGLLEAAGVPAAQDAGLAAPSER